MATPRRSLLRTGLGLCASVLAMPALIRHGRAAELKPVRIIDSPGRWASYELIFVADSNGLFKEQGLALELIPLPPDQYTVALDSGVTDFAPASDYAYFINVRDKGLIAKEIVVSTPNIDPARASDGLFVREDSPIQRATDLRGKKIGMTNVSFSSAWFTAEFLGQSGVGLGEVTYVPIPAQQQEQVLQSGDVDAIFAFSPIDAILRRRGGYRQIFQLGTIAGRRINRGGTMAKESLIRSDPDLVRNYATAIAKAADWANHNQAAVIQLGIDKGRIPDGLAPYIYTKDGKGDYSVLTWPDHGLQREDDVRFWLEMDERQGVVPKGKLSVAELYTNEFNPFASA
ncbi:ABC transporter substrate-binding protein [Arboricoccus pini]|nr:ABC transporter substrate-binding protein [Arboricoccus pini]